MQKTEITLSFDGEKLDALEFYLKKENTTVCLLYTSPSPRDTR